MLLFPFFDSGIPLGVTGKVREPLLAAQGQRQDTLSESPAHLRAPYEHLGFQNLAQRYFGGSLS